MTSVPVLFDTRLSPEHIIEVIRLTWWYVAVHRSMASSFSKVARCIVGLMLALGQQQVCGFSPIVASRRHMANQCRPPARHRTASRSTIQAVAINDAVGPVAGVLGVAALAIPLSIPIDQGEYVSRLTCSATPICICPSKRLCRSVSTCPALQGGSSRIDSIANTVVRDGEGDDGVRCYVARPDTDGQCTPHQMYLPA